MRCAGVFFIVLLLAAWISPASRSDHVRWVEESLRSMQSIQPGMTRADLNKLFVAEGGIGSRTEHVYVYRKCPYFKVRVEFEAPTSGAAQEQPADTIASISKPYLEWPVND